jgi:hypothetical protein
LYLGPSWTRTICYVQSIMSSMMMQSQLLGIVTRTIVLFLICVGLVAKWRFQK